jgi:hypothetical protein
VQHRLITSYVDAFEEDENRLVVRFATAVGAYWVARADEELVATLRRSLETGHEIEVLVEDRGNHIVDVISR